MNIRRMSWLIIGLFALSVAPFAVLTARAQQAVPPDIAPLLERERWLNGKCRGGSGDDPATADYCAVRDKAVEQLQAKGWCWGPAKQVETLKEWRPCAASSGRAPEKVTCATSGPGPDPVDPALAPKIVVWVVEVEKKLGLPVPNLDAPRGLVAAEVAAVVNLQAIVAEWEAQAPPRTVERFFRSAVGHATSVQYEMLMAVGDPAHVETHQFWVDVEAARADACLALIRLP
jgi:hypothetical protein